VHLSIVRHWRMEFRRWAIRPVPITGLLLGCVTALTRLLLPPMFSVRWRLSHSGIGVSITAICSNVWHFLGCHWYPLCTNPNLCFCQPWCSIYVGRDYVLYACMYACWLVMHQTFPTSTTTASFMHTAVAAAKQQPR
jgi:hypothetical protein